MSGPDTDVLLSQVLELLARDGTPYAFNFEEALLGLGCSAGKAEVLADYIPSACGRAFLREIGAVPSDTFQRRNKDGSWGPPRRLSDDPLWMRVEQFAETLRTTSERSRRQFSLAAQHSA